jgi:hypothetical protein
LTEGGGHLFEALVPSYQTAWYKCQPSLYVIHKSFSLQEMLMERSISRSGDLSLSYLTSLGIQSFAQYAGVTGGKPALVFDVSNYYVYGSFSKVCSTLQ